MNILKSIEYAKEEIEGIKEGIELTDYLPRMEEGDLNIYADSVVLFMPYSLSLYRQLRAKLGNKWVSISKPQMTQHGGDCVTLAFRLKPKDWTGKSFFKIMLDTSQNKSVCRVEKVGIKEVLILKVVCE